MSGATPYTVTELTSLVGNALAARPELEDVLVEGEISNLTRPSSGHVYLTLKDGTASLGCVCFRSNALRIPFAPENGMTVVAHGVVTVYPQQGRYQLMLDRLEPSGVGALAMAVEQRKRRLAAEGLLDPRLRRRLPLLPARVALVTSRTGAALHDVVTVMGRRAPCVDLVFSPATVQGEGAADTIVAALGRAGRVRGVEVVLLVRGGGSLEDLMAFNEESVARAIRACPVPVVTGIGHETDVTIADLVADHRAATPSAAAETAVPSCGQLRGELAGLERRLRDALRAEIVHKRQRARREAEQLSRLSPGLRVARMRQDVHAREARLRGALLAGVAVRHRTLERLRGSLALHSPLQAIPLHRERLAGRSARLSAGVRVLVDGRRRRLDGVQGRLEAMSPLRVIERGYSITVDEASGRVLRSATGVSPGAILQTRLRTGRLRSRVLGESAEVTAGDERMYDEAERAGPANEGHDG
ncbi:MAG TPA: exodeoxyribonuclease VII large subunit [Candidatus Dormibacteraeota bacterium]